MKALIAALAAGALLFTATLAEAAIPADFYGVNTMSGGFYQREDLAERLDAIAVAGFPVVRRVAPWNSTQPAAPWQVEERNKQEPGSAQEFEWEREDAKVAALAAAGLIQRPLLAYGVWWATGHSTKPPTSAFAVRSFAHWAGAYAERYGDAIDVYEIYNEPNVERFWPSRDPHEYAELYLAAREAVLAADPSATVMVAGLYNAQPKKLRGWLRDFFSVPGVGTATVERVAFHTYGMHRLDHVKRAIARSERGLSVLRHALDRRDRTIQIEINEDGRAVRPWEHELERRRARYLSQTARRLARAERPCGLSGFLAFDWRQPGEDTRNREHWYTLEGTLSGERLAATARFMRATEPRALAVCR